MSIIDYYQVDGLGINNNNEKDLIMLINDNLSWDEESEKDHLEHLQNKINAYVNYVKTQQYKNAYPDLELDEFTIDIHMNSHPSDLGVKFLDMVNRDLIKYNIKVIVAIEDHSNSGG
ncbi:DUF6572 domain-containing protein [Miniphocaeibacter massiliensis]|uniref:DUF6572 domain-containing protein n=1 Tax=Miniphocaeibacter massiliensis TaxID=2041841 RepID=UPI000C1C4E9B|nr:DUF6572 domain-containing protein [Miniphocaeibacter massiliensis]